MLRDTALPPASAIDLAPVRKLAAAAGVPPGVNPIVISLSLVLLLGGAVAAADSSIPKGVAPQVTPATDARARRLWQALPGSSSACRDFDYWPDGGMRNFYCHLLSTISWTELQRLAPTRVFDSGPHTTRALNLDSRRISEPRLLRR